MSVNPILLSGRSASVLSNLMRLLLLPGSERITGKQEVDHEHGCVYRVSESSRIRPRILRIVRTLFSRPGGENSRRL